MKKTFFALAFLCLLSACEKPAPKEKIDNIDAPKKGERVTTNLDDDIEASAAFREELKKEFFELFYGKAEEWCIIALLPSYLERKNSSLVMMADKLIQQSRHPQSGFYLNEFNKLKSVLSELEHAKQKTLLIGVTFGLLDFAGQFPSDGYREPLPNTIIMETGGMKGRRKEMTRAHGTWNFLQSISKRKYPFGIWNDGTAEPGLFTRQRDI